MSQSFMLLTIKLKGLCVYVIAKALSITTFPPTYLQYLRLANVIGSNFAIKKISIRTTPRATREIVVSKEKVSYRIWWCQCRRRSRGTYKAVFKTCFTPWHVNHSFIEAPLKHPLTWGSFFFRNEFFAGVIISVLRIWYKRNRSFFFKNDLSF